MSTIHRLGVACVGSLIAGTATAADMVDCAASKSAIDHVICADPTLLRKVASARRSFEATRRHLGPRDLDLFTSAERFWRWKRYACGNADLATNSYPDPERCVAGALDAQAAYLHDARVDARSISAHVADFDQVDVGYLTRYGRSFVGKHVSVLGGVLLDGCTTSYSALGRGVLIDRGASVPIRFEGLGDGQWSFLCSKRPSSSWSGFVRDEAGRLVFVADDVLGAPLAGKPE